MLAQQEDLFVWIHGDNHDLIVDEVKTINSRLRDCAELVDEERGFAYRIEDNPKHQAFGLGRDLTGFHDGTANPKGDDQISAGTITTGPYAGGSHVLVQRWVHQLDAFHKLPVKDQEAVIGRTLAESDELEDMPPTSHVARTDTGQFEIYRRSSPWGNAKQQGLMFLGFGAEINHFQIMIDRMLGVSEDKIHDHMTHFSDAVSGGFYYAPPAAVLEIV